jgi:small-conductance mechanosensitive channel
LLIVLAAWLLAYPCLAQEKVESQTSVPQLVPRVFIKEESSDQNKEPKAHPSPFPGLAEVVPRAADLGQKAAIDLETIAVTRDATPFEKRIADTESQVNQLARKIANLGDPAGWNIYRLLDVQHLIQVEKNKLAALLDPISLKLMELDAIRKVWEDEHAFWKKWEGSLGEAQTEIPSETFKKVQETATSIVQTAANASVAVLALQQKLTKELDELRQMSTPIEAALKKVRSETFQKNAPSFFSSEFYEPFNSMLWVAVRDGVADAWKMESEYLLGYGWIAFVQVLATLALLSIIKRRQHLPEKTREWHFIRQHPWAFSVFAIQAVTLLLLSGGPPSWLLLNVVLLAFSSALLISSILPQPRMRLIVFLLATVQTVSAVLKLISLPGALYSLYLALVFVSGIVFLLLFARRHAAEQPEKLDLFLMGLWVGLAVLFASLFLLLAGFSNLASYLVRSSVISIFSLVIAFLLFRLGNGCIEVVLGHPSIARLGFFIRFGDALESRLKNLLKAVLWMGVFLVLFQLWGIYSSFGQAWEKIFEFRFAVGELTLSLGRILVAGTFIYLVVSGSWFIRAFLDGEVFPRQQLDRGARDAIKRLIHYSLLFFGTLMAISLIGLNLTSLAFLTGALGIGVGFGLQNIVNNFVSGLMLLFERPFKVGDVVVVDNESGTVRKIGLRSTVIETFDRSELIVPNSQFISGKVTNWTRSNHIARIKIAVGVSYGSDVDRVLRLLKDATEVDPRVLVNPEPNPLFLRFGDSALEFELHTWISDVKDRLAVRSNLCQEIVRLFREAGIEIPFPQRDMHLRSVDEQVLQQALSLQQKDESSQ